MHWAAMASATLCDTPAWNDGCRVGHICARVKIVWRDLFACFSVSPGHGDGVFDPLLCSVRCTAPIQIVEYDWTSPQGNEPHSSRAGALLADSGNNPWNGLSRFYWSTH